MIIIINNAFDLGLTFGRGKRVDFLKWGCALGQKAQRSKKWNRKTWNYFIFLRRELAVDIPHPVLMGKKGNSWTESWMQRINLESCLDVPAGRAVCRNFVKKHHFGGIAKVWGCIKSTMNFIGNPRSDTEGMVLGKIKSPWQDRTKKEHQEISSLSQQWLLPGKTHTLTSSRKTLWAQRCKILVGTWQARTKWESS